MKKVCCLILALVMTLLCAGCFGPSQEELLAKVGGTWSLRYEEEADYVREFLTNYDFYEEEIALVTTPLCSVKTITLKADGTLSYSEPPAEVKACVREFLLGVYDELYEGRASLSEVYETDLSGYSKEEFLQSYADMYEYATFDAMIDGFVEGAYDWETLENYSTGTFTITSLQMMFDVEGTDNDGAVRYKVEGDTLTLTFSDATEVYTKVK